MILLLCQDLSKENQSSRIHTEEISKNTSLKTSCMTEEFREEAPTQQWLFQLALIQMLWSWIKANQSQELLENLAAQLKEQETFTQIVISQLLSQCQVAFIWTFKLTHTRRSLLISLQKENKELPQSSIWTGLQYLYSLQKCPLRIAVKQLKFLKEIMSYLTLTKKLSQCSMFFVVKPLSKQEWRCLRKQSSRSCKANRKSTKKLSMPS